MSDVLTRWNGLPVEEAIREILPCCGSTTWGTRMASQRPIVNEASMLATSDTIWRTLSEQDWLEAFRTHPRIGDTRTDKSVSAQSLAWSAQEQQKAATGDEGIRLALMRGNREYEQKFGRIFIVCATEKSSAEILDILERRLHNDEATELREAAEEQRQIIHIRLKKWLAR